MKKITQLENRKLKTLGFEPTCNLGMDLITYSKYLQTIPYERFGIFSNHQLIYESTSFKKDQCICDYAIMKYLQTDFTIHNHPLTPPHPPETHSLPSTQDLFVFQNCFNTKHHFICGPVNITNIEITQPISTNNLNLLNSKQKFLWHLTEYQTRLEKLGIKLKIFQYDEL